MGRGRVARLEFRAAWGAKKPDSLGRIGLFGAEVVSELLVETVVAHGCVFRYGKQGREGGVRRCAFGLDRAAVASDQVGDEERRQGVEVEGAVLAEVQRNDGGAVEGLEGFESVVDHSVKVLGVKE